MNRSNPRLFFVLIAVVLGFVLLTTACGSSDVETGDSATENETASSPADEEPEAASDETDSEEAEPADAGSSDAAESDAAGSDAGSSDDEGTAGTGMNLDLFFDGAIVGDVATEDCTLSGGTETTCYRITVSGEPADHEIGPFCPTTTDATADDGGIWFDGAGLYDIDGEFIVGLSELYDDDNWLLYDEDGNVNVTDTPEAFDGAARPDVAEEYQNHCVEGRIEWLENGEPITSTVLIPTTPSPASNSSQTRGNLGVTLNGVTIAAAAPVQAILGAYTIAAFDDCGGHINPHDGYHLHGAVGCSEVAVEGHAAIFGYAMDGYGVYSPTDEDGNGYDDLDACGGHTTDELGYHYHASPAAENAVITCLQGEIAR